MIEREVLKARAVALRAGGRTGKQIAGRLGISDRGLYLWLAEDASFRVDFDLARKYHETGDQEAARVLLLQRSRKAREARKQTSHPRIRGYEPRQLTAEDIAAVVEAMENEE